MKATTISLVVVFAYLACVCSARLGTKVQGVFEPGLKRKEPPEDFGVMLDCFRGMMLHLGLGDHWFIRSGTALGQHREGHNFLPFDSDNDVSVTQHAFDKISDECLKDTVAGKDMPESRSSKCVRDAKCHERVLYVERTKDYVYRLHTKDFFTDINTMICDEEHAKDAPEDEPEEIRGCWKTDKDYFSTSGHSYHEMYFPTRDCEVGGVEVRCPNDMDAYLRNKYGVVESTGKACWEVDFWVWNDDAGEGGMWEKNKSDDVKACKELTKNDPHTNTIKMSKNGWRVDHED